jgi:hypothetical protein
MARAMGLTVHTGWAACVVCGGTPAEPEILVACTPQASDLTIPKLYLTFSSNVDRSRNILSNKQVS